MYTHISLPPIILFTLHSLSFSPGYITANTGTKWDKRQSPNDDRVKPNLKGLNKTNVVCTFPFSIICLLYESQLTCYTMYTNDKPRVQQLICNYANRVLKFHCRWHSSVLFEYDPALLVTRYRISLQPLINSRFSPLISITFFLLPWIQPSLQLPNLSLTIYSFLVLFLVLYILDTFQWPTSFRLQAFFLLLTFSTSFCLSFKSFPLQMLWYRLNLPASLPPLFSSHASPRTQLLYYTIHIRRLRANRRISRCRQQSENHAMSVHAHARIFMHNTTRWSARF